jgi:rhomboid family GlyGly-CTERM serine protease
MPVMQMNKKIILWCALAISVIAILYCVIWAIQSAWLSATPNYPLEGAKFNFNISASLALLFLFISLIIGFFLYSDKKRTPFKFYDTFLTMILNSQLNQYRHLLIILLSLAVLQITLQALPASVSMQIRYERLAISMGEWWRLLSGHFLHLGWMHLALNLVGLGLIIALFLRFWSVTTFLLVFLFSLIAVDIGLWWFSPGVRWYVGLSGILHGLLIAGAIFCYRQERLFAITIMVGVVCKLAWEKLTQSSMGTAELIGGHVVVDAHLYGFTGGAIAAVSLLFLSRKTLS